MKNWAKFLVLCLCAFQVSVGCAFDASSAREAGANWLIERVGDRGGWEAYGDASAYAIRAFVATGRTNTPEYQRVLDRLLSLRMADGTYPSGAWSIWALAEAGYTKDDDELQGAVNSLINKYDPANCWGTNVSVNALNVIALVKAGVPKTHPCIKGTVNWLKK